MNIDHYSIVFYAPNFYANNDIRILGYISYNVLCNCLCFLSIIIMHTFSHAYSHTNTHTPLSKCVQFLSILPGRILKLLEFVGFSGDRTLGLTELEKGASSNTFRAPLCTSFLLFYYTVALVIMGKLP